MPPKTKGKRKWAGRQRQARKKGRTKAAGVKKRRTWKRRTPVKAVKTAIAAVVETKKTTGWVLDNATGLHVGGRIREVFITSAESPFGVAYPFSFMQMLPTVLADNANGAAPGQGGGVTGKSIFGRHLTMKVHVKYPSSANAPTKPCTPIRMYWGWVTPLNAREAQFGGNMLEVTPADVYLHILNEIAAEFNEPKEYMNFNDRMRRGRYTIIGKRSLMPPKRRIASTPGQDPGMNADVYTSISWRLMKKIHLETSIPADVLVPEYVDNEGSTVAEHMGKPPGQQTVMMYPNRHRIPFVVFFNKDHASYQLDRGADYIPKIEISEAFWYSDA